MKKELDYILIAILQTIGVLCLPTKCGQPIFLIFFIFIPIFIKSWPRSEYQKWLDSNTSQRQKFYSFLLSLVIIGPLIVILNVYDNVFEEIWKLLLSIVGPISIACITTVVWGIALSKIIEYREQKCRPDETVST